MVDTIKFSEMTNAGNINNNDIMPSLRSGENVILNNPWTFLPPGTTAERPAPSSTINYRLRFNTEEQLYEYYDAVLAAWTQLQESAFTQGPFVIYKADASIPDGQNLGALSDGILRQTISGGIATIDILAIPLLGASGGTGINNSGLTINLAGGSLGEILTSDSSGNATWQPAGYLTDAVLLNPSADQTITAHNLSLATGSMFATLGNFTSGSVGGGVQGKYTAYATGMGLGSIALQAANNGAAYDNILTNASTSAARTWTLPDASGTIALAGSSVQTITGDSGSATPSAGVIQFTSGLAGITFSGATNVMTLGGLLGGANGGTGVNNSTRTATYGGNLNFANSFQTIGNFSVIQRYTGATDVTFPTTGTLATTSQIPTGAALTKTDDANVTLTLGGSPNTALVNAASITVGWTGQLSFARGGTNVNAVPTTASASNFAAWDASVNLPANNFLAAYATTVTAAGTTTLTVASANQQFFTGSTTQTVVMPVTSTLTLGQNYRLVNNSSGSLTVNSSGANNILTIGANAVAIMTCILTSGTGAASWDYVLSDQSSGGGVTSVGSGTGLTGGPITSTGTLSVTGGLASIFGLTTVSGNMLYTTASNTYATVTPVIGGVMVMGVTTVPQWLANPGATGRALLSGNATIASWSNFPPVTSVVVQTITSTGTYTANANLVFANAQIMGGGGGSGGCASGAGLISAAAGGGGAAPLANGWFTAAQVGTGGSVTIGAAGAAATAGANNGGTGGTSTLTLNGVGTLALSSTGGVGGGGDTTGITAGGGLGGAGGSVAGGVLGSLGCGASGGNGTKSGVLFSCGGKGADSVWGAGGISQSVNNGSGNGNAGVGYGSGASGAVSAQAGSNNYAGTAGRPGALVVIEYIYS